MKNHVLIVISIVFSICTWTPALAFEGYYTHWWTPYSPSCVYTLTLPYDPNTQGEPQVLVTETISLGSSDTTLPPVQVEMEVIRKSCTEENRSALFIILKNPSELPYRAPKLSARIEDETYQLRLAEEPNTRFEDYASKALVKSAMFVIDGADFRETENAITADQYNGAFQLVVEDTGGAGYVY
jgi:hypothetical protein